MYQVFISYSRKTKDSVDLAEKLKDCLTDEEWDVWIDIEDLPVGSTWEQEISEAIVRSDFILFLLCPEFRKSDYCMNELIEALEHNKKIYPVRLTENEDDIPPEVKHIQWFTLEDLEKNIDCSNELKNILKNDPDWIKLHTELDVKATKWKRTQDNGQLLRRKELQEAEVRLTEKDKDPIPTELQRLYVMASRRHETRMRNILLFIIGFVGAILVVATIIAITQRNIAKRQLAVSRSQSLAFMAQEIIDKDIVSGDDFRASTLLAIESMKLDPNPSASQVIAKNIDELPSLVSYIGDFPTYENMEVYTVNFIDNNSKILSTSSRKKSYLWNVETGEEIFSVNHDEQDYLSTILSPDGKFYATSSGYGQSVYVWNIAYSYKISDIHHEDNIISIDFNPDGSRIVSASDDGVIKIWNSSTGVEVTRINYPESIEAAIFNYEGDEILVGSSNSDILTFWNAFTGEKILRHIPNDSEGKFLAFSPNSRRVAYIKDEDVIIWDEYVGRHVAGVVIKNPIRWVNFSNNGELFAITYENDNVEIWDLSRKQAEQLFSLSNTYGGIQFSLDGTRFAVNNKQGYISLYKIPKSFEEEPYEYKRILVNGSISFSGDNNRIAVINSYSLAPKQSGAPGVYQLRVWETAFGLDEIRYSLSEKGKANFLVPEHNMILSLTEDDRMFVWSLNTKQEIYTIEFMSKINEVAVGETGILGAAGGDLGVLYLWNLEDGRIIYQEDVGGEIMAVAFSPDEKKLAYVVEVAEEDSRYGVLYLMDLGSYEIVDQVILEGYRYSSSSLVFDFNGVRIMTANGIWQPGDGVERLSLEPLYNVSTFGYFFSSDGQQIIDFGRVGNASSGTFSMITSHDINSKKEVWQDDFQNFNIISDSTILSPNGKMIAVGGIGEAIILNAENGEVISNFFHDDLVTFLAFSPDNQYIASSIGDDTVYIWESFSGKEIVRISQPSNITSLFFSEDGHYLITGGSDNIVRGWLWYPEDIIAEACTRLDRNFNLSEWEEYMGNELPYSPICDPENFPEIEIPDSAQTEIDNQAKENQNNGIVHAICVFVISAVFFSLMRKIFHKENYFPNQNE